MPVWQAESSPYMCSLGTWPGPCSLDHVGSNTAIVPQSVDSQVSSNITIVPQCVASSITSFTKHIFFLHFDLHIDWLKVSVSGILVIVMMSIIMSLNPWIWGSLWFFVFFTVKLSISTEKRFSRDLHVEYELYYY